MQTSQEVHAIFHALTPEQPPLCGGSAAHDGWLATPTWSGRCPTRCRGGRPALGPQAAYFVGGRELSILYDDDPSILHCNEPPRGQPGLWCKWVPNEDGPVLVWSGAEKFYDYVEWLTYLIEHFLAPWGYFLDGEMTWQGEREEDRGILRPRQRGGALCR